MYIQYTHTHPPPSCVEPYRFSLQTYCSLNPPEDLEWALKHTWTDLSGSWTQNSFVIRFQQIFLFLFNRFITALQNIAEWKKDRKEAKWLPLNSRLFLRLTNILDYFNRFNIFKHVMIVKVLIAFFHYKNYNFFVFMCIAAWLCSMQCTVLLVSYEPWYVFEADTSLPEWFMKI